MSDTLRAFIAIDMPAEVTAALDGLQQKLRSMRLGVRWVQPGNIHLTLKFLGDIKPAQITAVAGMMAETVAGRSPLALSLGGIGFFPGVNRPRVIWAGLGGETRHLVDLQAELADRLAAAGFPRDKRRFKAHLTLGRVRPGKPSDGFRQALQRLSGWGGTPFAADRITLFRSDLKPSGALYTELEHAKLCKCMSKTE